MNSIMPKDHDALSTALTVWSRLCCRALAIVSMSLVTRESVSPNGWAVEVESGSRRASIGHRRRSYIDRWMTPDRIYCTA
jgi:hypothetical protein